MGDNERTVSGLDPDDDGSLVKPIVKQELLARVRSIVRQAKPPRGVWVEYCYPMISLGLLTYDTSCRGEVVHMRPTECRMLAYLPLNDNRVLSH